MKIVEVVKHKRFVYSLYYFFGSLFVNFLKLFIKPNDKLILFVSYGGRYYNDSPRYMYEYMLNDVRFKDCEFVWAFKNPDQRHLPGYARKIKIDGISYYIVALSARIWITNVMVERALNFKGKDTYYFHTTHGTLPKKTGHDATGKDVFRSYSKFQYDCSCAQSGYEAERQLSMYNLRKEQILLCGYPKNDKLANSSDKDRCVIKERLGIPQNKIVILYAPTYREDSPSQMISPIDFNKWENCFGNDYFVLYRAHPVVSDRTIINASESFLLNVSKYSDNEDLMIVSNVLVSDYSGIFFEYAVLCRPMYCFAYDYDEYIKTRELYFDVRDVLPGGHMNEDELIYSIKRGLSNHENDQLTMFREKYVKFYGNATEKAVNNIYERIYK